jgi:hypothetical protein
MNNDLIDTEGFEFFTENEMLRQHCHLLETELAELHSELKESRGKIATLVLMWSGVRPRRRWKWQCMRIGSVRQLHLKARRMISLHLRR